MAYKDQAALSGDSLFLERLQACVSQESTTKPTDPLAAASLKSPADGLAMFTPFVTSSQSIIDFYADPGGSGQSNVPDQAILSAVQADWANVAAVNGLTGP